MSLRIETGVYGSESKLNPDFILIDSQHTFINERQHHNHTAHHILAVYSLGATAQSCRDTFNFAARETVPLPILLSHPSFTG